MSARKSLHSRVRNYFRGPIPDDSRLATLRRRIRILDYIAVGTETEALILEAHLIKQYAPRFNVQLKDDKRFPYIKVTTGSPFPGMFLTRHVVPDGSRYFGPYIRVKDLRKTLKVLRSVFQLRNCTDQRLARDERECLQFFIGRCTAPCTHRVDEAGYRAQVEPLLDFLGRTWCASSRPSASGCGLRPRAIAMKKGAVARRHRHFWKSS
ncbi:MAG: hypothetical protein R3E12_10540 [Candidatus Eisenbacteria bacterium]